MVFNCSEQLAGIAELQFFLLTETDNWPLVITDGNSGQVEFNQEPVSVEAILKPDSIKVDVNKKQSSSGVLNQISIKMEFITRSEALEQLMDQYENKPGVCLAKYNSEFQKLFGNNLEPLKMIFEVEEGGKIDDNASTIVMIKGETRKRPVYYTV